MTWINHDPVSQSVSCQWIQFKRYSVNEFRLRFALAIWHDEATFSSVQMGWYGSNLFQENRKYETDHTHTTYYSLYVSLITNSGKLLCVPNKLNAIDIPVLCYWCSTLHSAMTENTPHHSFSVYHRLFACIIETTLVLDMRGSATLAIQWLKQAVQDALTYTSQYLKR